MSFLLSKRDKMETLLSIIIYNSNEGLDVFIDKMKGVEMNPNNINRLKNTAIIYKRIDIFEYMFHINKDDYCYQSNMPHIKYAVMNNSMDCLRYLLENFPERINEVYREETALQCAVLCNYKPIVKLLLENGAEVSDEVLRVSEHYPEIKKMLEEHLANIAAINNSAKSARMRK
jgi:ankyrin repeat protein